MTTKKRPRRKREEEVVVQIGPSLHLNEDGDPVPPPYKRYVVVKKKRK